MKKSLILSLIFAFAIVFVAPTEASFAKEERVTKVNHDSKEKVSKVVKDTCFQVNSVEIFDYGLENDVKITQNYLVDINASSNRPEVPESYTGEYALKDVGWRNDLNAYLYKK